MVQSMRHILLIDDDKINNFLTREIIMLYYPGTHVQAITNPNSALNCLIEMLHDGQPLPDIILLDINMPVMDGWEFLEALSSQAPENNISSDIYIYTSSVYEADITKAKGFSLVKNLISKPLSREVLDEMMR